MGAGSVSPDDRTARSPTRVTRVERGATAGTDLDPRRWITLGVVIAALFIAVVDNAILTVAIVLDDLILLSVGLAATSAASAEPAALSIASSAAARIGKDWVMETLLLNESVSCCNASH